MSRSNLETDEEPRDQHLHRTIEEAGRVLEEVEPVSPLKPVLGLRGLAESERHRRTPRIPISWKPTSRKEPHHGLWPE